MKASELRIGNYVWDDYDGVLIVDSISKDSVRLSNTHQETSGKYSLKQIKPIEIHKDWLLDFGFKKDPNRHYRIYHGRNVPVRLWEISEDDWVCVKSNARVKYVHQLQNLFFALTGEELTIKEKV